MHTHTHIHVSTYIPTHAPTHTQTHTLTHTHICTDTYTHTHAEAHEERERERDYASHLLVRETKWQGAGNLTRLGDDGIIDAAPVAPARTTFSWV